YRSLPVGFLHCCRCRQPACHLLTVRSVTPARKGLPVRPLQPGGAPSGMKLKFHRVNPLEIFHTSLYCLSPKICIFNIFSEPSVKCAHAHAGHTHRIRAIAGEVENSSSVHLINFCSGGQVIALKSATALILDRYAQ